MDTIPSLMVWSKMAFGMSIITLAWVLVPNYVQITDVGMPAPNAACLAGACPKLALRTFPKNTSCTSDGSTFALSRAPAEEQEFA